MVFEQIFKLKWIEKKEHAFFLGFIYTIIGAISAKLIFPASMGLMSVAFTSILLIPSLAKLLRMEENVEIREKKFHFKQLFKDHKDIFKVYIFLFLGVFLAYAFITLMFSQGAITHVFDAQLRSGGIYGKAIDGGLLTDILLNNLLIFFVCFVLSFIYGAGAILFITWNASVWGVVFAFVAKLSSPAANPFAYFGQMMLPFLPHMITEAVAYLSAAIVGGIVSKAVLREDLFSKKFHHIVTDALIFLATGFALVFIAAVIEVAVM